MQQCFACGEKKCISEFSKSQLKRNAAKNKCRCKLCVQHEIKLNAFKQHNQIIETPQKQKITKIITIDEILIFGYIRIEIEKKLKTNIPSEIKQCIALYYKIYIGSHLITKDEECKFLHILSTKSKLRHLRFKHYKLLYRASDENYSAQRFHHLCNGHGPTIVIIQSHFGNIFGGYTVVPWSSNNRYNKDKYAFLFLIRSCHALQCPQIFPIITSKYAVYHHKNNGPIFGNGYDIYIARHAAYSCTSGASSYKFKGNQLIGSNDAILSKDRNIHEFQLIDYEVFQLI